MPDSLSRPSHDTLRTAFRIAPGPRTLPRPAVLTAERRNVGGIRRNRLARGSVSALRAAALPELSETIGCAPGGRLHVF